MADRRQSILDAAAAVILAKGYDATTIADIRAASGASTGSVYHAFGSKEGVAFALAGRALNAWAGAVAAARRWQDAEGLIRATVEGLVRWGFADPTGFLILDRLRGINERGDGGVPLAGLIGEGREASGEALARLLADRALRALDPVLLQAMILGPAYEFLRFTLPSRPSCAIEEIVGLLCDAAWEAVRPRS